MEGEWIAGSVGRSRKRQDREGIVGFCWEMRSSIVSSIWNMENLYRALYSLAYYPKFSYYNSLIQ